MLILSIIAFVLMLSFLVIIHELGHFVTARLFKIKIEEFGLGYPPHARTLFTWKGIPFTLNWIPVGGFVRMEGENGGDHEQVDHPKSHFAPFYTKSRLQRFIVILAGATINFLFGVLAFTLIYSYVGIPFPKNPPQTVIAQINDGPAKLAGLQENDLLVKAKDANGDQITIGSSVDFMHWILSKPDTNVTITYKRNSELHEATLHTRKADEISTLGAMSVSLAEPIERKFYPWYRMPFEATKFGLQLSLDFSKTILGGLGKMGSDLLHKGKVPTDVAGPIGIVSMVAKEKLFSSGWLEILNFTAMFSINLAIMNVLPIPALDGGRALFILLEFLIGRKRVSSIEQHANAVGFGILVTLILLISIKDVWMLFR